MNNSLNFTVLLICFVVMFHCYSANMDSSSELEQNSNNNSTNSEYHTELIHLRTKIDVLDRKLLAILRERMLISVKVGELKKKFNKPVLQPDRLETLLQKFKATGSALGLKKEFTAQIFNAIHEESVNIQNEIGKTE